MTFESISMPVAGVAGATGDKDELADPSEGRLPALRAGEDLSERLIVSQVTTETCNYHALKTKAHLN